jgi:Tol biopolymer transport system component
MPFICVLPLALMVALSLAAQTFEVTGPSELYARGRVSTEYSEIRVTFHPDGERVMWGSTNRPGGPGGLDLWESRLEKGAWSAPRAVSFGSPGNDFDPSFSPDGRSLWFFSNRPGGFGGDDLWVVSFDPATGRYGTPENAGPTLNSKGDEWAPVLSPDGGTLLFATDGRGGKGMHDLFTSTRVEGRWSEPKPLEAANSPDEDFDATFLHDRRTVVLTRRAKDQDGSDLWVVPWTDGRYGEPARLGPEVNAAKSWNLGPSLHPGEPGILYFSSHRPGNTAGRTDIYRVPFRTGR